MGPAPPDPALPFNPTRLVLTIEFYFRCTSYLLEVSDWGQSAQAVQPGVQQYLVWRSITASRRCLRPDITVHHHDWQTLEPRPCFSCRETSRVTKLSLSLMGSDTCLAIRSLVNWPSYSSSSALPPLSAIRSPAPGQPRCHPHLVSFLPDCLFLPNDIQFAVLCSAKLLLRDA